MGREKIGLRGALSGADCCRSGFCHALLTGQTFETAERDRAAIPFLFQGGLRAGLPPAESGGGRHDGHVRCSKREDQRPLLRRAWRLAMRRKKMPAARKPAEIAALVRPRRRLPWCIARAALRNQTAAPRYQIQLKLRLTN